MTDTLACTACHQPIDADTRAVILGPIGYHRGCWRLLLDPAPAGPLTRRMERRGRCRLGGAA